MAQVWAPCLSPGVAQAAQAAAALSADGPDGCLMVCEWRSCGSVRAVRV
jgi:hypothetical protein